jgi:hypothetical protein
MHRPKAPRFSFLYQCASPNLEDKPNQRERPARADDEPTCPLVTHSVLQLMRTLDDAGAVTHTHPLFANTQDEPPRAVNSECW